MESDLVKQLEDKKKGCGTYLYDSDFEDLQDLFEHRVDCGVQEVITGEMQYCKTCQAEIAILEQAIVEMQKQRQEILDEIGYKIFSEDEQKSNNVWYKKGWDDSAKRINKVIQEVKELNCLPINYIEINEKIDKLVEEQLNQLNTQTNNQGESQDNNKINNGGQNG